MKPPATPNVIISRHRLPRGYRVGLTVGWLLPIVILGLALLLRHGATLLDLRVLGLLALMALPAVYIWHEGIDVLPNGIIRRVHVPRYFPYERLDNWYFDSRETRRTLTVWDVHNRKVMEVRAGHLTEMPALLQALQANVRWRNWPD